MKNKTIISLFCIILITQGCSSYDPVDISQCKKVVKHAQKVLGKFAPSRSEMMSNCKQATDQERGCIMAATKAGQAAQCFTL